MASSLSMGGDSHGHTNIDIYLLIMFYLNSRILQLKIHSAHTLGSPSATDDVFTATDDVIKIA